MPGMGLTFAQNPQRGQGQVFDGINWVLAYTAQVQGLVANGLPMVSSLPGTMTDSGLTVDRSESVSLINLAHGAGPTTPINGDTWTTTTGQRNRINGATQAVAYTDLAATYSVPLLTTSTGGIGYATGAGGTVTQATSKATAVTLSKNSGTITLNAASLAANTSVAFTWTNTVIAATDVVVCVHDSVGTLGAYGITVTPGAGTATVTVRNNTAGALAEAIVLRFIVLKGVVA